MLTRSGVAKRLGKSIATVRRLENVALHPVRDSRGVLQFSEEEVEHLARGQAPLGWQAAAGKPPPVRDLDAELRHRDAELDELRERTLALEQAHDDDRTRFLKHLEELEWQARRTRRADHDTDARSSRPSAHPVPDRAPDLDVHERERLRVQATELLASLSPRQMRRMPPDDLEAIIDLAEGD